ncbi:MAG TPA: DUF262 domain-containing protein [Chitinophagaceae bacterium]|nr:DUF262 domain-containing protein [Chitinophagaceae bacterium]
MRNENKSIIEEINAAKKEFVTDAYTMSIGELNSIYKEGDLIINPDFQRAFRWSSKQQSKLIESILIGVPLPSIFVYQREDGKWEVVDGVQRLSTILQFIGELKDENGKRFDPTVLEETKLLSLLKDMTWVKLPVETQLDFKRSRIEVKIIKYLSDRNAKFEVFQRLNYSPTILSGQEYRNALLIMINKDLYDWVLKLSKYPHFSACIDLTERWLQEKYDQELVFRFFIFPDYQLKHSKVDEYIDDAIFYDDNSFINRIADTKFDYDSAEVKFNKTFDLLFLAKGEDVFKKPGKGQQFLESYFEAIAIGLYWNIGSYTDSKEDIALIEKKINEIENGFPKALNTTSRIPKTVEFGKEYFRK